MVTYSSGLIFLRSFRSAPAQKQESSSLAMIRALVPQPMLALTPFDSSISGFLCPCAAVARVQSA